MDWDSIKDIGPWLRDQRIKRDWSQADLAERVTALLARAGSARTVKQQTIDQVEKIKLKSVPDWVRYAKSALEGPSAKSEPDTPAIRKASDNDGSIPLIEVDLGFSMGDGSNLDDYIERGTIDFDANLLRTITHSPAHRLFVARGDGDSMMPTLIDNDQVVIDTLQRDLTLQDRIWACSIHGAGAIKRLRAIGKRRVLVISDNPTVDNQEVNAEDLRILGRVVWVGRRV